MNLDSLREQLDSLDRQLIELAARRQALSREVARVKGEAGLPTRDYARERDVILRARAQAESLGVQPALAEALLRPLIEASLTTQEQARVVARGHGTGKRALVIGGAGRMGRWFSDFLTSQGFSVEVADPAGTVGSLAHRADWRQGTLDHDLIVIATPLGTTADILTQLAARKPRGLVFDVGSLKTPLRAGLDAIVAAGCEVTSVHPMFGPDTQLLSGRHVLFIDLGRPGALTAARELFAPTMAEQVVMTLDEHDRLIAYVLGLSHALNIAFFTALAESGEAAPHLAQLSSTTFDAQLDVAHRVAAESPSLYYEIQSLNAYGRESLDALAAAVERIRRIVGQGSEADFAALMTRGKAYLDGRTAVRAKG